ncbi:MAG TPA: hypothetical protein VEK34_08775 [Methylocella sp.]|nr:hypothetical protein [Methylocella sp.]
MRIFLGIVIGIALTIGAAYIADSARGTNASAEISDRPFVNWDVIDDELKALSAMLGEKWSSITKQAKETTTGTDQAKEK